MLRPDYTPEIVRNTNSAIINNRRNTVSIYRAAKRVPKMRRRFGYDPEIFKYDQKSDVLKIYQVFHDRESYKRCIDTQYVTRLSLDKYFREETHPNVEVLGDICFPTNQISETRAFLHATLNQVKHKFVGFTSHKHDLKFYSKDYAALIGNIDEHMVAKAFDYSDLVKMIAFRVHPPHDFISNVVIGDVIGTVDFMYGFFHDVYKFDRGSYDNLVEAMYGKIFPYCNCFITKRLEIKQYADFVREFLFWVDSRYGLDSTPVPVRKAKRSYGENRGWGYICEQLIWYYLAFKYGKRFMIAFIDDGHNITYHDRIGYGVSG